MDTTVLFKKVLRLLYIAAGFPAQSPGVIAAVIRNTSEGGVLAPPTTPSIHMDHNALAYC